MTIAVREMPAPVRAVIVEDVLDAWGMVNPLRYAAQLLLDYGAFGRPASRVAVMAACRMLIAAARNTEHRRRTRRSSDVLAIPVAKSFGVECLAAVLIELRWAGLAATAFERDAHLDVADQRLADAMAEMERGPQ